MPFKPADSGGGEAPKEPHMVMLTGNGNEGIAIPPGCILYIIEDAKDPSKMFPMGFIKVNRKAIHFRCLCHDPNCTRTFVYKLQGAAGHHNSEQQRTQAHVKKQLTK